MEYLNLKGMTCPMPVVETKRLLESKEVRELEVILDDAVAFENVKRFLGSKGFSVNGKEEDAIYRIRAAIGVEEKDDVPVEKTLYYIDGETVGRGSEELGGILMRSFLNTLKEMLPWRLVFVNGGVKLLSEESPYLSILKELEGAGVEMLACGTCLDYYGLKGKIGAGRISNMFEILTAFTESDRVIKP